MPAGHLDQFWAKIQEQPGRAMHAPYVTLTHAILSGSPSMTPCASRPKKVLAEKVRTPAFGAQAVCITVSSKLSRCHAM